MYAEASIGWGEGVTYISINAMNGIHSCFSSFTFHFSQIQTSQATWHSQSQEVFGQECKWLKLWGYALCLWSWSCMEEAEHDHFGIAWSTLFKQYSGPTK
jgi:hypothetical protein